MNEKYYFYGSLTLSFLVNFFKNILYLKQFPNLILLTLRWGKSIFVNFCVFVVIAGMAGRLSFVPLPLRFSFVRSILFKDLHLIRFRLLFTFFGTRGRFIIFACRHVTVCRVSKCIWEEQNVQVDAKIRNHTVWQALVYRLLRHHAFTRPSLRNHFLGTNRSSSNSEKSCLLSFPTRLFVNFTF